MATMSHYPSSDAMQISLVGAAISAMKSGIEVELAAARNSIDLDQLRSAAEAYQRALSSANALDLDDLPFLAVRLLREHLDIRLQCQAVIEELMIDEYQDTNPVQQELVGLLAPPGGTVTVVGDEDQSIYGWRHASADGFVRFQTAFPGTETVMLQQSYRHCKFVARAADALMSHGHNRTKKSITTELPAGERPVCFSALDARDEADWIARQIVRLTTSKKLKWDEIAVLYRINAQSRALEDAMVRSGIPYRVLTGRSFYARIHVQAVVAYLRLSIDPDDDIAAQRLLEAVSGVGPGRILGVRAWAELHGVHLVAALSAVNDIPRLPSRVRTSLKALEERLQGVGALRKGALLPVVAEAIRAAQRGLEAQGLFTESVREDFDELLSIARVHGAGRGTLRSLTDRFAFEEPAGDAVGEVHLISLHGAKGLEYRAVFVAGLEEGVLPHARSLQRSEDIEEERRLCYVGMTRARETLHLSYAQARLVGSHQTTGRPSRFIKEIGLQNMTLQTSSAKRLRPRFLEVGLGDRVHHTRWGPGTVRLVEGSGADTLVTVRFDVGRQRRVQLCRAPLSRLDERPLDVADG